MRSASRLLVGIVAPLVLLPLVMAGCASSGAADPAPEDSFARARRMIDDAKTLSLPKGNYRIDVERIWLAESDDATVGAIFDYRDNSTAVRVGSAGADPGFRISVGGSDFRASLSASLSRTQHSERTQNSITTIPDAPAYLEVGEVRYGVPIYLGPRRGTLIIPEGQFTGTSLEAVVSPAGPGEVTIQLTPHFSAARTSRRGRGGATLVTEMSTTVRIPLGRPVLIGKHNRSHDSVASSLLSRSSSRGNEQAVIILTVTAGTG